MKINDYASSLTKREGKKESLTVAQISEVLKLINADFWGIPYALICLKRGKKSNERGEIATLTVVAIAVAAVVLTPIVMPLIKPLLGGGNDNGQKITQRSTQKDTVEPFLVNGKPATVQLPDGEEALLFKRSKITTTDDQTTTPPAPLAVRIFNWFFRLGLGGLVLALAFPGAFWAAWAFIGSRFRKLREERDARKEDLDVLGSEIKKIVASVDAGLDKIADPAIREAFLNAMSRKQDTTTKALVAKAKQS